MGSVFRWMRLLLYEQCSDHITENRPELGEVGLAAEGLDDALVLALGEAVLLQ